MEYTTLYLLSGQVVHASGDLVGEVDQVVVREGVRPLGPHGLPYGAFVAQVGRGGAEEVAEEVAKVAVLGKLNNHVQRSVLGV